MDLETSERCSRDRNSLRAVWDHYSQPFTSVENDETFADNEERADQPNGLTEDACTRSEAEAAYEARRRAAEEAKAVRKAEEESVISLATVALDADEADELLALSRKKVRKGALRKKDTRRYKCLLKHAKKNIEEGGLEEKARAEPTAQGAATSEEQVEDIPEVEEPISRDDGWFTPLVC